MAIRDMRSGTVILGVHFGHDASAAIVVNGAVLASALEERFSRCKHSGDTPLSAIAFCLQYVGIHASDVDCIALAGRVGPRHAHEFEVLFGIPIEHSPLDAELVHSLARSERLSSASVPLYLRLAHVHTLPDVRVVDHHLAHAASVYLPIAGPEGPPTLVATLDGVGDDVSSCIWRGVGQRLEPLLRLGPEASLGLFYGAVTEALGWWAGDGEGTTMGLAAFGTNRDGSKALESWAPRYEAGGLLSPCNHEPFGSIRLRGAYHDHLGRSEEMRHLLDRYRPADLAAEAQDILERNVLAFVLPWLDREGTSRLACSGGVFLNVKLNQRLWQTGRLTMQEVDSCAGDGGLAMGAALAVAAERGFDCRQSPQVRYGGPEYSALEIQRILDDRGLEYRRCDDVENTCAQLLADGLTLGWFQGRMEVGPRALGNRSILMNAARAGNKDILNARVKFRESFRPFAPSLLESAREEYLLKSRPEPAMTTSFDCSARCREVAPAVVHVDGTARPQTVDQFTNPRFAHLLQAYRDRTGVPLLLNTSLNLKGEPIACTPHDALRCFVDSGLDALALGEFLLTKSRTSRC